MSDDFPSEGGGDETDYSGPVIVACLAPVFFVFAHFDKADMGLGVCIALGIVLLAIKFHWKLRRHVWFWVAVVIVLAIQIPLLSMVRWPHGKGPTLAYTIPLGLAEFVVTSGAIRLGQKLFPRDSSSEDNEDE